MKCAKCGLDLPEGARQCPKCGTVNEFAVPPPQKRKWWVYAFAGLGAIAVLALVVAVIAGMGRNQVTSAPPGTPGPGGMVTTAPPGTPAPGSVITAPPAGPPPVAQTPASVPKPKPPKAVVDYLDFVKKVEEHRQMLLKDTGDALTLLVGGQALSLEKMFDWLDEGKGGELADPLADVKNETGRQYKNWLSTLTYFDKRPAPNECREFSGAYRDVLYRETAKIGKVVKTLAGIDLTKTQDIRSAAGAMMTMKKDPKLQGEIDTAADTADAKLSALVSNYDMEKPFSVPREERASGSILGF